MAESMVTGRMSSAKKAEGNRILREAGLNSSQAINMLYDRIVEERDVSFLIGEKRPASNESVQNAVIAIRGLKLGYSSDYATMTRGQVKLDRFAAKEA